MTMKADGMEKSHNRSPLDEHRIVVAGATFDELDERYATGGSNRGDLSSVASTVDVDNTHPYLIKYADMYAHDNADDISISTGPTFVDVRPSSQFKEGQKVLYNGSNGPSEAIIIKIMHDTEMQPHYTIKLASGTEKQTKGGRLGQKNAKGATDENGNFPLKCVDFRTTPTLLFQSLYQGKWSDAQHRLQSHPEEASIWVARYAKKSGGSNDVRWKLLPLHLYIALGGRTASTHVQDVPSDEKDEFEQMEKESDDAKTPPMQLLVALLSAYPQATQCTDDLNMIPLHSAIRGTSSLSIIEKLLEADPLSVYRKDVRGRNAFVLAEKVFGKRINNDQADTEDKARESKHGQLMTLLSNAASRVASHATPQPKEKVLGVQKSEKKEEDTTQKRLQKLQNENLALRRENAMLHHRADINERLLRQLVDKLQMYEEQRSVDIENYNEIFGSKDEIVERREEILLSISEDNDGNDDDKKADDGEEKQLGGEGAYHKRLERYLQSTPTKHEGNTNIISPISTVTEDTEPATPATPSVMLPKLESCDEDDVNYTDKEMILDEDGVEAKGVDAGSISASESDESAEGQDIFRPRDSTARYDSPAKTPNEMACELDTLMHDVSTNKTDCAAEAVQPESDAEEAKGATDSETKVASAVKVFGSMESKQTQANSASGSGVNSDKPILPALSQEEEDQLRVE